MLSAIYNKNFFYEYASRNLREHPEQKMDSVALDIEQFHSVNALNGREFGDQVLRALGREIYVIAGETGGIAGRFEADRFDICCQPLDNYQPMYDRLQKQLDELQLDLRKPE